MSFVDFGQAILSPDLFPPDITNLFKHCLRTSYFVWDGSFYEQTDGVAMDSPLSLVVANLFIEQFESLAIETAVNKPRVWWRYVDDTFVVWPHGSDKLDRFLEHLNGVHPKIQFTMELTVDVRVNRNQARVTTSVQTVFRKPTHTDRYLHNQSNYHPGLKNTVVRTMVKRARRICSEDQLKEELDHLRQALRCNGYAEDLINRAITSKPRSRDNYDREIETLGTAYLLYINNTTDKIARVIKRFNIRKVFDPTRKVLF
ncbi:hypothetical protein Trydic_g1626 [Trypoxylus dichotomus]